MLEPSKPVTLKTRYTPYPAVQLQSDEESALRPGSVILHHRHLKQQFTVVPSSSPQRPHVFAPPRCSYQLVASTSAVPAAVPPSAVPPGVTLLVSVGSNSASPSTAPSSATVHSTSSSIGAIPPMADSSVAAPLVVPAALAAILHVIAHDNGIAAPSGANPLLARIIPTPEGSPAMHGESFGQGNIVSLPPLPVQAAARRNMARSHEVVETGNSNLVVRRGQRAIRDKKGQTIWFYSDGQTYLLEPPILESARLGDLYVHTAANRDQQIWILNRNLDWEKVQLYHPHPLLPGYVLHRVSGGEPCWIHKTTVTTYRGREKRYQQICSRSDAGAAPVTLSGRAARLADTP